MPKAIEAFVACEEKGTNGSYGRYYEDSASEEDAEYIHGCMQTSTIGNGLEERADIREG